MYQDKAKIIIKSGNGGDGCTSFFVEKHSPLGGPDGGDGGKGGDVVFEATSSLNTLIDFRYKAKYKAEDGTRGDSNNKTGRGGADIVVRVPVGTVIKDFDTGSVLADMYTDGSRKVIQKGGLGGKGNAKFKSSRRRAPHFHQTGERTEEHTVVLELKTIADVGFVGFPNVGKSTLLSMLTAAKPKIANYHFTTLSPNLGVVQMYSTDFVIADIPGLIEGAAQGAGLGHEFLRHVERTRLLVHLVDISGVEGREPLEDYKIINSELKEYSETLSDRPMIIALNKCDLLQNVEAAVESFSRATGKSCYPISAVSGEGLKELLNAVYNMLKELPKPPPIEEDNFSYDLEYSMDFEVVKEDDDVFMVQGGLIRFLTKSVVLNAPDSFAYFQKMLVDKGVINALRRAGAKNGDTVIVGDVEFDFVE